MRLISWPRFLVLVGAVTCLFASPQQASAQCYTGGGATVTVSTATALDQNLLFSSAGCTINVAPGTYQAPTTYTGGEWMIPSGITVVSTGGASATTLTSTNFYAVAIWPNPKLGGNAQNLCPNGATLDGFTLQGPSGGVYVGLFTDHDANCTGNVIQNVTLRNLIISGTGASNGINFNGVQNSVIDTVNVTSVTADGVILQPSTLHPTVHSDGNIVMNSTFASAYNGIGVQTGDNNVLVGNTFTNTQVGGITLASINGVSGTGNTNTRIDRNSIADTITVTDSSFGTYVGLNTTTGPSGRTAGVGVWVNDNSNGTLIFGNEASSWPENGIDVWQSYGTHLIGNSVHDNVQGGIWVASITNAADPSVMPGLAAPDRTVLQGNYVYHNQYNGQIFLQGATNSQLSFNFVSGASLTTGTPQLPPANTLNTHAIQLTDSTSATVFENVVSNVFARAYVSGSSTAKFFRNRFLFGSNNAFATDGLNGLTYDLSPSAVQWDGGAYLGGNYWSEYTSATANPDSGHPYTAIVGVNTSPYVDRHPYAASDLQTTDIPDSVTVLEPVAGSYLPVATKRTIHWVARGCALVDITTGGGASIASAYPNTGYYFWTVSGTSGTSTTVQVACKDASNNPVPGVSPGTSPSFTISAPNVILLNPGRGSRVADGGTVRVAWTTSGLGVGVNIYVRTGTAAWTLLTPIRSGTDWADVTMPSTVSDSSEVSIKIQATNSSLNTDTVDGYFMVRGTANVKSLASSVAIGSVQQLEWTGPAASYLVDIDLLGPGTTTRTIAKNVPDFGGYTWFVDDMRATSAQVRLTFKDASGNTLTTASSAAFALTPMSEGTASANDFDGDGKADLIVYRASAGTWYTRYSAAGGTAANAFGLSGDIPVPGDYDGDGQADAAVFRPSNHTWYIQMSSTGATATYSWGNGTDIPVPGDYDGDGKTDIAVYRSGTWYILTSSSGFTSATTVQWGVSGDVPVPGDYNGDHITDAAVYRPSNGTWYVWQSGSGGVLTIQWGLRGDEPVPGDYDGDGKTDLAVWRSSTGMWYIKTSSSSFVSSLSYQWGLPGDDPVPADYDGDGKIDLAVFRPANGTWYISPSSSGYATSQAYQWGLSGDTVTPNSTVAQAMTIAKTTVANLMRNADFDGDGHADITVFRPSTGQWFTRQSSSNFATSGLYGWGESGDVPVPGDYDGDGVTDIAVFRPTDGSWWLLSSSSGFATGSWYQWGLNGDTPVVGDFDGDGKADLAVWRPSNGTWYIVNSSSGSVGQYQWGLSGDVPVPGDYDGDGISDLAVFRPADGTWYIKLSSTGFSTYTTYQWGLNGDIAVPGDYDGDGITDIAVYRPSAGYWFIKYSSTNFTTYSAYQWGLYGDVPVPGDYDGDGKIDLAVYRPSVGWWFVAKSSGSYGTSIALQWGLSGDTPILKRQ